MKDHLFLLLVLGTFIFLPPDLRGLILSPATSDFHLSEMVSRKRTKTVDFVKSLQCENINMLSSYGRLWEYLPEKGGRNQGRNIFDVIAAYGDDPAGWREGSFFKLMEREGWNLIVVTEGLKKNMKGALPPHPYSDILSLIRNPSLYHFIFLGKISQEISLFAKEEFLKTCRNGPDLRPAG